MIVQISTHSHNPFHFPISTHFPTHSYTSTSESSRTTNLLPLQIIDHHIPSHGNPPPPEPQHLRLMRIDHRTKCPRETAKPTHEDDSFSSFLCACAFDSSSSSSSGHGFGFEVGKEERGCDGEERDGRVEDGDVFSEERDGCQSEEGYVWGRVLFP